MKIIKEGRPNPDNGKPVNFTCKNCGCEFIAEKGEYRSYINMVGSMPMIRCSTDCPNCDNWVETEFIDTEEFDLAKILRM